MSDVEATIRCDCGCSVLVFDYWKWNDSDNEGWFDVYTTPRSGFRYRLSAAWRVLRGKDPWVDALAFGPKQIKELHTFLHKCMESPTEVPTSRLP